MGWIRLATKAAAGPSPRTVGCIRTVLKIALIRAATFGAVARNVTSPILHLNLYVRIQRR